MKKILQFIFIITVISFSLTGCEIQNITQSENIPNDFGMATLNDRSSTAFCETFETGLKRSYTAGEVTLTTGKWYFTDALLGSSMYDNKNGQVAVRIRNSGKVTMQFDLANGAGTVTIAHSVYNKEASTTWELYKSTNAGMSWTIVENAVTTSSSTLAIQTFILNQTGAIRFEIRKTSGTGRMNIDDVKITDYSFDNDNALMGNPSNAVANESYPNNYLMVKNEYTLAYNSAKKTSIWVSWHLSTEELGTTGRQDDFRADMSLPSGWYKVIPSDYLGSGFDKGHICPSADRTLSIISNSATFLMINMIPQAPNNNQKTWNILETYELSLVDQGNELYVIAGPEGQGGQGSKGTFNTIGNDIVVPNKTWKIIVVLPNGNNDLSRITISTRVIAVVMPNNQSCNLTKWYNYRVTVRSIEQLTGFDFMSNIPESVQDVIENRVDANAVN